MLPVRQRGHRWRIISPTTVSFVAAPIVISSTETNLTDGGVPLSTPTFVPVDSQGDSVLICDYTGKEVVE
jgi:hypothetical protein